MTVVSIEDQGVYVDAEGKEHAAQVCAVWPDGNVNVVFTEGGTRYADCNVPVLNRQEANAPGRFFERGQDD